MTVRELCSVILFGVHITFDKSQKGGDIDVYIPRGVRAEKILREDVLNLEVYAVAERSNTICISTDSRKAG